MTKATPPTLFQHRLEQLRTRLNLNGSEFSRRLGITQPKLSSWVNRGSMPLAGSLTECLRRLDVEGWELLDLWLVDADSPPPPWLLDHEAFVPTASSGAPLHAPPRVEEVSGTDPIPWMTLETLAARAREARRRGALEDGEDAKREFFQIVKRLTSRKATT